MPALSLIEVSQWSVVIPLIAALLYYKRYTRPFKMLSWYIILAALTEVAAEISKHYSGENIYIAYAFFPLEFMLFFFIFQEYLRPHILVRRLMFILLIIIPTIILYDLNVYGLRLFNAYTRGYAGGAITLMALFALYFYFKTDEKDSNQSASLWLYAGTLIYFAPNFFAFVCMNEMINNDAEAYLLFKKVHAAFNIIYYLFYTIAFLHFSKQTKS